MQQLQSPFVPFADPAQAADESLLAHDDEHGRTLRRHRPLRLDRHAQLRLERRSSRERSRRRHLPRQPPDNQATRLPTAGSHNTSSSVPTSRRVEGSGATRRITPPAEASVSRTIITARRRAGVAVNSAMEA
jgi:hypothetical protein